MNNNLLLPVPNYTKLKFAKKPAKNFIEKINNFFCKQCYLFTFNHFSFVINEKNKLLVICPQIIYALDLLELSVDDYFEIPPTFLKTLKKYIYFVSEEIIPAKKFPDPIELSEYNTKVKQFAFQSSEEWRKKFNIIKWSKYINTKKSLDKEAKYFIKW